MDKQKKGAMAGKSHDTRRDEKAQNADIHETILHKNRAIINKLLCGALGGCMMLALWVPVAYMERGYWSAGGEWLMVAAGAAIGWKLGDVGLNSEDEEEAE